MVVCKYFLQGYCRFGSQCRFEHDNSFNQYENQSSHYTNERASGTSILRTDNSSFNSRQDYRHNSFQASPQISNQNASFGLKYSVHEIMQAVSRDVAQSETGNQWQLSVYSPLRELPNLPGLEDQSPEELRWECYKAAQNGSVPIWQAIVQQMYANVAKTNNDLKKKDSGFTIIDRWLRGVDGTSSEANASSVGTSQMTSSAFGGITSPTQSIFGGSQPNSSVFGGNMSSPGFGVSNASPSMFGGSSFSSPSFGANNTSLSFFGGSNMTTPQRPGGNTPTSLVFGGNNTMASPGFGGNNSNSSVFGGANTMTASPGFGGNNTSPSMFGSTMMTSTSGYGGNDASSPVFGGSNMMATNSGFGGENTTPSVFGGNNTMSNPNNSSFFSQSQVQPSNNRFSQSPQPVYPNQSASPFSSPTSFTIESHNYSMNEELTDVDLAAFKADKFTFRSIPTQPPPQSLCGL